jgi:hypothetical protein
MQLMNMTISAIVIITVMHGIIYFLVKKINGMSIEQNSGIAPEPQEISNLNNSVNISEYHFNIHYH